MEEKNELVSGSFSRYFDTDAIKIEFTVEEGYMKNIAVDIKDRDMYPRIDPSDRRRLTQWLNSLSAQLSQYLASAPLKLNVPPPSEELDMVQESPSKCPRCNGENLAARGTCCGGKGTLLICGSCGLRIKVKA